MLVNSIELSIGKDDAIKYMLRKVPLISKINQFNRKIDNIHLEYIELKVIKYKILIRIKNKNNFRIDDTEKLIIIMVNTYNGVSKNIDNIPNTVKRYIAKSCIKNSNIKEDDLIKSIKQEILIYLDKIYNVDKYCLKSIEMLGIDSIYKPYWIGSYNEKDVFIEA